MKNCVQKTNVFGFPLQPPCGGRGGCVDAELAASHEKDCYIEPERCIVHLYTPEDEFLTFVKEILNEQAV